MKKALFVATVGRFFGFERNDIKTLQSLGYEVHIATNLCLSEFDDFQADGIIRHQIDFARIPWSKTNLKAYKQLKTLLKETHFDLVHCHTPMGGVIGRFAAKKYRKSGMKVMYTAHGFHFYNGAPIVNWIMYYPVEWISAFWTDVLITINKEDYARAQMHMHAKKIEYIHGIGIDTDKFSPKAYDSEKISESRKNLGLGENDKLILSVGELNTNKNHESVIRAVLAIGDSSIHYAVAGAGELGDYLKKTASDIGISKQVHILGFRSDVSELYQAADLYIHPSLREGLPVALMEAIASKTPVICSDIRGNTDLVGKNALFEPKNINQIAEKICEYLKCDNSEEIERNYAALKEFDVVRVSENMRKIYANAEEKGMQK